MLQETMVQDRLRTGSQTPQNLPTMASEGGLFDLLDRAAHDDKLLAQLADGRTDALMAYDLTWEQEAALMSGDIRWIEAHVGKLSQRQRTWLECRLQQESW